MYYGHNGQPVTLKLVPERVGVVFKQHVTDAQLANIMSADQGLSSFSVEPGRDAESVGRSLVLEVAAGAREDVRSFADALRTRDDIESVNLVYKSRSGKESLVTDYVCAIVERKNEGTALGAFAQRGLAVYDRTEFKRTGRVSYRLHVAPSLKRSGNTDAIAEANALHEHPAIKAAAPQFSPLYTTATTADWWTSQPPVSNDPVMGEVIDGDRVILGGIEIEDPWNEGLPGWSWSFNGRRLTWDDGSLLYEDHHGWAAVEYGLPDAWKAIYGETSGHVDWEGMAAKDNIVIAVLDDGAFMEYSSMKYNGSEKPLYWDLWDSALGTSHWITDTGIGGDPSDLDDGDEDLRSGVLGTGYLQKQWVNYAEYAAGQPHPGLFPSYVPQDEDSNGYPDDFFGWDFVGSDPSEGIHTSGWYAGTYGDPVPFTDYLADSENSFLHAGFRDHGHAAAALAAGVANNGVRVAGFCPSAQVMPLRYHVNLYRGESQLPYGRMDVYYNGRLEKAIVYATENGAHAMVCMAAMDTYDPGVHEAVRDARAADMVISNTPDNEFNSLDAYPWFPAAFKETLVVAGCGEYKDEGQTVYRPQRSLMQGAASSGYGWQLDAMFYIDSRTEDTADPANIRLTSAGYPNTNLRNFSGAYDIYGGTVSPRENEFFSKGGSGNSSANPQGAAFAALLMTADPALSPADIQFFLRDTAEDMVYTRQVPGPWLRDHPGGFEEVATVGRDKFSGFGRANPKLAVERVQAGLFAIQIDDAIHAPPLRSNRPDGVRNLFTVDADGNVIFDGRIAISRTPTYLASIRDDGIHSWPDEPADPVFLVVATPTEDDDGLWPTLYISGIALKNCNMSAAPTGSWEIDANGDTIVDAYISPTGQLCARHEVFQAAKVGEYGDMGLSDDVLIAGAGPFSGSNGINLALQNATGGDIIEVLPGTYEPINVTKDVTIRSTDPYDPYVVAATIIDGSLVTPATSAVTFDANRTEDCALIGFTIRNGNAVSGGGINGNGCEARILYNVIQNNSADWGGGIANCDGLIEHNVIGGSTASKANVARRGGGLFQCNGTVRKNLVMYNENSVHYAPLTPPAGPGVYGGAAFSECNGDIVQNFVAYNTGFLYGGAMNQCQGGSIRSNILYANEVVGTGGTGWDSKGGGMYGCSGIIEQNTLYANRAWGMNAGGGVADCTAEFVNTIFWDNESFFQGWYSDEFYGGNPTFTSCCIEVTSAPPGTGNIGPFSGVYDPGFARTTLMENAIPEQDNRPTYNWGQFLHLAAGSPCIDAGYPDDSVGPTFSDFDDQLGPHDGDDPYDPPRPTRHDIGADEYPTPEPPSASWYYTPPDPPDPPQGYWWRHPDAVFWWEFFRLF